MKLYSPLTADIISQLRETLGATQLTTDPQALEDCSRDTSDLACRPELGAIRVLHAPEASDRERIWGVRRQVSLRIHDAAGLYLSEDVVAPIGRIAELVAGLPRIEEKHQLKVYTFGHAGDGNIHLNFTAADPRHKAEMEKGIRTVLQGVLAMGGTISGEHGIGIAKQPFIDMELPVESARLQKGIKTLFDPQNILNPEKIFNWREENR